MLSFGQWCSVLAFWRLSSLKDPIGRWSGKARGAASYRKAWHSHAFVLQTGMFALPVEVNLLSPAFAKALLPGRRLLRLFGMSLPSAEVDAAERSEFASDGVRARITSDSNVKERLASIKPGALAQGYKATRLQGYKAGP